MRPLVFIKTCSKSSCRYLASSIVNKMLDIKTFIFLDSETTGLPYLENNTTKVTELCLVAVESAHIRLGVYPRVQNKLSLCFNPRKCIQKEASDITGLTNFLLEFQPEFSANIAELISKFLDLQSKPVCFVAHNGNRFDYPILRAELSKTNQFVFDGILCIDSLQMFKDIQKQQNNRLIGNSSTKTIPVEFLDGYDELLLRITEEVETKLECISKRKNLKEIQKRNETTPKKQSIVGSRCQDVVDYSDTLSCRVTDDKPAKKQLNFGSTFRLEDLYRSITSKIPVDVHKAEGDVTMLLECAAAMGDQFVDWANQNAKQFSEIPEMTPYKKIGVR